jgi:hypothetical protein
MYWKQKINSTPQVDVEELKRQQKRELLGDLKPILEAQGIQFPNIVRVMSKEEHCRGLVPRAPQAASYSPNF